LIARIGKRYSPELQQNWEHKDVVIGSSEPNKKIDSKELQRKYQTLYIPLKYTTMGKVGH
jgi:hypothetical protein